MQTEQLLCWSDMTYTEHYNIWFKRRWRGNFPERFDHPIISIDWNLDEITWDFNQRKNNGGGGRRDVWRDINLELLTPSSTGSGRKKRNLFIEQIFLNQILIKKPL